MSVPFGGGITLVVVDLAALFGVCFSGGSANGKLSLATAYRHINGLVGRASLRSDPGRSY
jgi:hypothetical protein